ncbi:hypothetical protein HUJ05_012357 [Dendroctonus ponderosae]|nr:hypothetical protein HUJ05_012357 [Dendroctonus ponderosae]
MRGRLVCTFYSTIGGMKAVLMTDVFQSLLMFIAVFSVIGSALYETGSFSEIWRIAAEGNRTDLLNFNPDPTVRHSWLSLILGGGITFLSLYAVNQIQVQRYLTIKDLKRAQFALWWNWPILTSLSLCTSFAGLSIYSKYYNCDPVSAQYISSIDQLMPYYVVDTMGHIPGLSGLFVAGIFSAALSTVSAALNSLAAVTMEDYYKPLHRVIFKKSLSSNSASVQTKIVALIYGVICIGVAFLAQFLGGILQAALTIFGVVGGPLLGLFSLGMFTLVANEEGSVVGLFTGIGIALNYLWIHRVSYLYNGVAGFLITFILGYLLSWIIRKIKRTPVQNERYDPNLFVPPLANKLQKAKQSETRLEDISDLNRNGKSDQGKIETIFK